MTIDRWIFNAANSNPNKIALEYGEQKISYAQFALMINVCVEELAKNGTKHGDRIAWYGLNHPDVFVLLFACARIGAVFVPLNWRLAEPEVATIVSDCAPSLLFYDGNFTKQALALPSIQAVAQPHYANLDATSSSALGTLQADSPADATVATITSDPVLLVYTSGSTGLPKGALLSQRAIACNAAMSVEAHQMSLDDRALVMLPLFHVGGLNILPTPAFSIGATVILHEKFDPNLACDDLPRATLAITVPTVLQAMMANKKWSSLDLSSVRGISIGSTDVPTALIESIHQLGIPMPQIYGATETGPFAIYQTLNNAMDSIGSIGQAGSQCQIRLVMNGKDVGVNEPGEIWVKGDNILNAYWNDTHLSEQSIQDGWLRTGDVATCDASGFYWFKDRIKHVIISGGENIYPTEVERALRQIPGITEVSVVGKPDSKWGEIPVAVVVANQALTEETVLASLQGQLARYKHPKKVVFVEALPRNAMGKIVASNVRRLALRE